eukprot:TRINITY_DN67919_c21_g1_i1.p1 TRINITY_DN67919_c21_g1~~TRINITY_DN67919_c21_g1_i1.p1  ORF type:complete len:170 (-),score=100.70 TRINITY_DN67919_c21_g1_i1:34-507(-)
MTTTSSSNVSFEEWQKRVDEGVAAGVEALFEDADLDENDVIDLEEFTQWVVTDPMMSQFVTLLGYDFVANTKFLNTPSQSDRISNPSSRLNTPAAPKSLSTAIDAAVDGNNDDDDDDDISDDDDVDIAAANDGALDEVDADEVEEDPDDDVANDIFD